MNHYRFTPKTGSCTGTVLDLTFACNCPVLCNPQCFQRVAFDFFSTGPTTTKSSCTCAKQSANTSADLVYVFFLLLFGVLMQIVI